MRSSYLRVIAFAFLQTRIGLVASTIYRIGSEFWRGCARFGRHVRAILASREFTNYTYHLSDQSRRELVFFVASLTQAPLKAVESILTEIEQDDEIASYYAHEIARSDRALSSDVAFKPGRMLLHYAIIRLMRPSYIFEAGVDKGFGALIMNRALMRNGMGGQTGRYIGAERRADRPAFLIDSWPDRCGDVQYANWQDVFLSCGPGEIEFLFWDATTEPEHFAFMTQHADRLSKTAIIVSAWTTPAFFDFARDTNRNCLVFHAIPHDHWFEGADLAVAFPNTVGTNRLARFE